MSKQHPYDAAKCSAQLPFVWSGLTVSGRPRSNDCVIAAYTPLRFSSPPLHIIDFSPAASSPPQPASASAVRAAAQLHTTSPMAQS